MNHLSQRNVGRECALIGMTLFLFSSASLAETFPFRVGFEDIPGVEKVDAANIHASIDVLEAYLRESDGPDSGNVLAALCGAYVLSGSYEKAETACDRAVNESPTEIAFNNRGVYRAMTGDFDGARADFRRARPAERESYLEDLRQRDIGLIAFDNSDLMVELSARHTEDEVKASVVTRTASVEQIER